MDPRKKTKTIGGLKRLKTGRKNKDFISELPDPIIVHILSFLPLKDAINTLLVRRFGNLWRKIPVLDVLFHDCDKDFGFEFYEHTKFTRIIRHVMDLHDDGTLDKLCLKFYFSKNYPDDDPDAYIFYDERMKKDIAEHIEKLILYALSRNVKILDVNLKGCFHVDRWDHYDFPDVFTSRYLTELRLTACNLTLCTNIDLKLLKVLFLNEISLTDDTMENFLIGCPLLEDLSVVDCYDLNNLNCKNPNLKKVRVCHPENTLFVSCPYAISLEMYGYITRIHLLDASSVVDASINFNHYYTLGMIPYRNVTNHLLRTTCEAKTPGLLHKVCKSKTLSLCARTILLLSLWNLMHVPCPFFFCKNLILRFDPNKWYFPGLEWLLRSSSIETLTINVDPFHEHFDVLRKRSSTGSSTKFDENLVHEHDFDGDSYWDSHEATLPHLETILVSEYRKKPSMIELVKFLLRSAPTLQKMVIKTNKTVNDNGGSEFTSEELLELAQKLLRLPRASSQAIICFS